MKEDKASVSTVPTVVPNSFSPTVLQVSDFIYALAHSYDIQPTTRWSIYLSDLRDERGDAVFTGDIYTHDQTCPPRFYRWLRFHLSHTKGIHNLTVHEDQQVIKEIPAMTFQSFMDYAVELFEPGDFTYKEPASATVEYTTSKRRKTRRSKKKPSLQEIFDFCYEVSYHNGGSMDWSIGVSYLHDNDERIYYDFSPGYRHQKGAPVQRFIPSLTFCYSERKGIYAAFFWEDVRTPVHSKKLSIDELKDLVCRLYQIDSNGRRLSTKET